MSGKAKVSDEHPICYKHSRYKGKGKPTTGCWDCWQGYAENNGDKPMTVGDVVSILSTFIDEHPIQVL